MAVQEIGTQRSRKLDSTRKVFFPMIVRTHRKFYPLLIDQTIGRRLVSSRGPALRSLPGSRPTLLRIRAPFPGPIHRTERSFPR